LCVVRQLSGLGISRGPGVRNNRGSNDSAARQRHGGLEFAPMMTLR
jgi:hypothetical protein